MDGAAAVALIVVEEGLEKVTATAVLVWWGSWGTVAAG